MWLKRSEKLKDLDQKVSKMQQQIDYLLEAVKELQKVTDIIDFEPGDEVHYLVTESQNNMYYCHVKTGVVVKAKMCDYIIRSNETSEEEEVYRKYVFATRREADLQAEMIVIGWPHIKIFLMDQIHHRIVMHNLLGPKEEWKKKKAAERK